jgi:hypothetical protein
MGIRIDELNSGVRINDTDVTVLSQIIEAGLSARQTLKVTAAQIRDSFNADNLNKINDLTDETNDDKIDKTIFNKFLPTNGSKPMTGDLYMDGSTVSKYSAKILTYTDNFTLTQDLNTSVILVDKENPTGNSNNKVSITITPDSLNVGYNVILIQSGNTLVEVLSSNGIEIWNSDGLRTTRGKYSLINICILKPNTVWLFGDVAGVANI